MGKLQSNYKALPMLFRSTKTEVHTDGIATKKQPKVVITDELGWVYEPDASTGVLTRTKGKVSIENTDEPVKPQSDRERTCDLLRYRPEHFIGWDVYKKWSGFGVCHGMIVSAQWRKFSQTSKFREVMTWTVVYDDQDSEDLTTEEMEKWSIDCIDGKTVTVEDQFGQDENIAPDNMGIANVQLPPVSTDGVAPT